MRLATSRAFQHDLQLCRAVLAVLADHVVEQECAEPAIDRVVPGRIIHVPGQRVPPPSGNSRPWPGCRRNRVHRRPLPPGMLWMIPGRRRQSSCFPPRPSSRLGRRPDRCGCISHLGPDRTMARPLVKRRNGPRVAKTSVGGHSMITEHSRWLLAGSSRPPPTGILPGRHQYRQQPFRLPKGRLSLRPKKTPSPLGTGERVLWHYR